jgi:MFS family permease
VIGSAADKIGNKKTLITGFIVLSATLLWLPFAKELWMLYLFSSIFGFGWATFVLESPIIAELFGLSSHGLLFGFTDAGATIGGAIGAVLIGYLFDITGNYQLGFLILGVASLTGLIFALLLKPTTREKGSL